MLGRASATTGVVASASLLLLAAAIPTVLAAEPRVGERVIIEDPEDQLQGALDLLAVYASESFGYDADKRQLQGDFLHFRIEPRSMADLPEGIPVRFHVGYAIDGEGRSAWADVVQPRCANSCDPPEVVASNVAAVVTSKNVILNVAYAANGLAVGLSLDRIFAATGFPTEEGGVAWQDVAPRDDSNLPHGTMEPTAPSGAGSLLLNGPYPYVDVTPVGSLSRMSVDGEQVKYDFDVKAAEGITGEIVYFLFETSETWRIDPSHGESGAGAIGMLINLGASPVRFSAGVFATTPPDRGANETTRMHVISSSGAHHVFDLVTTVTGPRVEDPEFSFAMDGPDTIKAGTPASLPFDVRRNGVPLVPPAHVSVDLYRNDRFMESVRTDPAQAGVFDLAYVFEGHGTWRLEPFVSSLKPSPTATFTVEVEKDGIAGVPGPGAVLALVGVAGAAAARSGRSGPSR